MLKKLPFKDLCSILGVAEITVKTWRRDKLPGRILDRKLFFQPEDVYLWLIEHGKVELAAKLEALYQGIAQGSKRNGKNVAEPKKHEPATNPQGKAKPVAEHRKAKSATSFKSILSTPEIQPQDSSPAPEIQLPSLSDIEGMNIFEARRLIGQILRRVAVLAETGSNATLAVVSKEVVNLSETLRRMELSCIEVDTKLKAVIEVAEAQRIVGKLLTKVKTDLRSLPASVSDKLASISDPKEINIVLSEKIDDALRHISDSMLCAEPSDASENE